jgi:hypothetical protein
MSLSTDDAARILGVAPYEIISTRWDDGGWWALQHDMASHIQLWRHIPGSQPGPVDEPVGDLDGDGVPDGGVVEVLGWVGGDRGKAGAALVAETVRDKPRSTLIAALERLTA